MRQQVGNPRCSPKFAAIIDNVGKATLTVDVSGPAMSSKAEFASPPLQRKHVAPGK